MLVRTTNLPNGLTVVTAAKDAQSTTVCAFAHVGAINESAELNGISHFLEHMAFKGTTKRTAHAIAAEAEQRGAIMNAYTSDTHTAYYMKVLPEHTNMALDVIADILTDSVFPQHELDTERGVILQEHAMYQDDPSDRVYEAFKRVAFKGSPLGRSILGPVENIKRFTRTDFINYMDAHYSPHRTIVVGAGKVDHDEFVSRVAVAFGGYQRVERPAPLDICRFHGGMEIDHGEFEQCKIIIGLPGPGQMSIEDYYKTTILAKALGGGMSSPLFQEVREKRGLCYSVRSDVCDFVYSGAFTISGGTSPENVEEFIKVSCGEFAKMTDSISDFDIERAKTQFRARAVMSRENPFSVAGDIATDIMFHGEYIPLERVLQIVESVTKDDLKRIAFDTLMEEPALAITGPVADKDWYGITEKALAVGV